MPAAFISSAAAAPDIFGNTNLELPPEINDCTVRLAMTSFRVCVRFVLGVGRFLLAAFATEVFDMPSCVPEAARKGLLRPRQLR